MSSCDKFEPDRTEFEKKEPGFFTYTGKGKCKHCGRAFHDPSGKVIQAGVVFAAGLLGFTL